MKARRWAAATLLAALVQTPQAVAHSGGTNAEGCHTNRKTGDYHCHGGGRARPAPAALRAVGGGQAYYPNCAAARAAGAAPVRLGDLATGGIWIGMATARAASRPLSRHTKNIFGHMCAAVPPGRQTLRSFHCRRTRFLVLVTKTVVAARNPCVFIGVPHKPKGTP